MLLNEIKRCAYEILPILNVEENNPEILSEDPSWMNYVFHGDNFRRAHFEIVDELENHGIYLIHLCVYPHTFDPSPILGIDFVYSQNKIIGAFHDFSPIGKSPLNEYFDNTVGGLKITNKREFPLWGVGVFNPNIISTGDITDIEEMKNIVDVTIQNTKMYFSHIGTNGAKLEGDYKEKQNHYAVFQKKNPHIKRMLLQLGKEESLIDDFIENTLFPEL